MGKASRKKWGPLSQARNVIDSSIFKSSKKPTQSQVRESLQKPKKSVLLGLIFIILFSSFAVYFNSLSNGFVFDDTNQVLNNRWITDIRYLPEIFSKSVWSFQKDPVISNYYRPLMHVIYMFNYHLFGLSPWGFHLINIIFHAGVSLLVFFIILKLLGKYMPSSTDSYLLPSSVAALLFATHPMHTESVTWIAGLPDLSFTLFYLLSFFLYILYSEGLKGGYVFSVVSFTFAAFSKEPALTLPIILLAYDYAFKKTGDRFSHRIVRYLPYLAVSGVYLILRFHALGGFAPTKRHQELNVFEYAINIFPLFTQYLEKLFLPVSFNAFYVLHPIFSIFETRGILSFFVTAAFIVLIFISAKKNHLVFLGLILLLVPLLPVLYIPALGENTFAERYLYLPSFGFVFLFALLLAWAKMNKSKEVTTGLTVVALILIVLYSFGTVNRNTVWKDNDTFYTDTLKKSPDAAIIHYSFGLYLQKQEGKLDDAIEQFQIASKLDPYYPNTHGMLGVSFFKKGWLDKAIEQFLITLQLHPEDVKARNNLGYAFFKKGQIDKAIEHYQMALQRESDYAHAHYNLGTAFFMKGDLERAIEHYQIAIQLEPDLACAHNELGLAFFKKGQIDKAIEQYQAAVKLIPSNSTYRINLEQAIEKKDNPLKR
jgi:Tfp pilus assembly protein PilF